ncbi:single-stranded DNA-binding protein [Thermaerobacter litoralis]
MLNVVVLIGRLVRDPELRYTPSGVAVGRFTVAVDRPFTNQQGERETDFIDIVVWRKLAETCANHLSKGRLVAVRGRLQVRSYETQDGQRRRAAEVVADDVRFLDRAPGGTGGPAAGGPAASDDLADFGDVTGLPDDDIPF